MEQIGFSKYLPLLVEQDIDLRIFLTLTENDLKEIGITYENSGPSETTVFALPYYRS